MYEKLNESKRSFVTYPDNGVEIIIPHQEGYERVVVEEVITTEADKNNWNIGDFQPIREAINFKVKFPPNSSTKTKFNPPILLKVKFTYDELKVETKEKPLDLAFYSDKEKKWIRFTDAGQKLRRYDKEFWTDLPPEGITWAGYFVVEISEWGDPSVSVGQ